MNRIKLFTLILFTSLGAVAAAVGAEKLPNQAEPLDNLVVAGQPTEEQLQELANQGFAAVINLRRDGEFDDFDENAIVTELGMEYLHIPVKNVQSIDEADVEVLHTAISNANGPVLLHCTVGWRAAGLLAIERYLKHGTSREDAYRLAVAAHMSHAADDVDDWIKANAAD